MGNNNKKLFSINDFNPSNNYVIEASAGTGKTYNIIEIIKKMTGVFDIPLNKVLIVTFTEKAAGELKNRIKEEILNVNANDMNVFTIHSFCKKTLDEFSISSNEPIGLSMASSQDVNDFIDAYIREGEVLKFIEKAISLGIKFNEDNLKKYLSDGLSKYYLDLNYKEDPMVVSLTNNDACEYYLKSLIEEKAFAEYIEGNEKTKDFYNRLLKGSDKNREFLRALESTYKSFFNYSNRTFSISAKDPNSDVVAYFRQLQSINTGTYCDACLALIFLPDLYQKWAKTKKKLKIQTFDDLIRSVREGVIQKDSNLLLALKNKYSYAIIDEFQDTNQLQFDIFREIFMTDDNHKIIVVGDPKQSIYSFQGSDVEVYKDAISKIAAKENSYVCSLNKNFRSTFDMVNSCNKLFRMYSFSDIFEDCTAQKQGEDKQYFDVRLDDKDTKAFWIASSNDDKEIDEFEFARIAAEQILYCCSYKEGTSETRLQIKNKNSDEFVNVSFKDFTVLVKSRSEIICIENEFKRIGIPFVKYKDNSLFSGKECADWIVLLEALDRPDYVDKNRNYFKKSLFTKFFGCSLEEIDDVKYSFDDTVEMRLIYRWKDIINEKKWEDLIDDILVSSNLYNNLCSIGKITNFACYNQIGDAIIDYLSKGHDVSNLIRWLKNMKEGNSVDDDGESAGLVARSTDFDCVQIMTEHASKGLQFPVVIALCGFKGRRNDSTISTIHKTINGKRVKEICISGNKDIKEILEDEDIKETERLFYVAYTRAQYILMLPFYKKVRHEFIKNTIELYKNSFQSDYRNIKKQGYELRVMKEEASKIVRRNILEQEDKEEFNNQEKILKDLIKNKKELNVYKHSYSSLTHGHEETNLEENEDTFVDRDGEIEEGLSIFDKNAKQILCDYDDSLSPIEVPSSYPYGKYIGTALHEVFEILDFTNYAKQLEKAIDSRMTANFINLDEESKLYTRTIIKNVLNAKFPVIHGNQLVNESFELKGIDATNKKAEVEFNFNIRDEKLKNYANGSIDLIFKRGEYYSIIDWKSDKLNEEFVSYSNPKDLKRHVDDAYSIQRVLYSYCLIKWLKDHYPNLSEQEIFEQHFGGVYYVFIRGCNSNKGNGIYAQTWEDYEALEKAYKYIMENRIWR